MLRVSLLTKVLGAMLLLSLLPLGLLLFNSEHSLQKVEQLLTSQTTQALDHQARQALQKRSEMVARQIADFLAQVEGDLHDLALLPADAELYRRFSRNHQRLVWSRSGTNTQTSETRESVPLYSEISYVDAAGFERIRIVDGVSSSLLRRVADPAQTTYRTEDYFARTLELAAGDIWVTHLLGWHVSRAEQLRGAENSFAAVEGRRYEGVIRFSTPLYSHGQFSGMVVLSLDHRHLMEFSQHINPVGSEDVVFPSYESGNYAFIFDDEGWAITHPNLWDIRGLDPQGKLVPAYTADTPDADLSAGRTPFNLLSAEFIHPHYPLVARAILDGRAGVLDTTNIGGSAKIMAFAPIRYSHGVYQKTGYFGAVTIGAELSGFHQPAESLAGLIRHEIDKHLVESWLVIALTVAVIVVVAYLFANSIVLPLRSLTNTTRRMIAGQHTELACLPEQTHDEVAVLAESFNQMIRELNGRRERLLKTLRELRKSRRELLRERNFKNTVFENIESGILTFDSACNLTWTNGPACQILNISEPDRPVAWHEVFRSWPEISQVLGLWFTQAPAGAHESFRVYVPLVRQNRKLTYRLALFPLSFRAQIGWLLTVEDLTERVNMRQQMARMDRLASLGRMSAGIAHEIRNPLTGVSLLLDELHDRLLGSKDDQLLIRKALEEIERLDGLVNEMLRFATLPEPQLQEAQLGEVVRDSIFLLHKQFQKQQIELIEEISADLPDIRIDNDRLKQVLLNLFNNALDAMPHGGRLRVALARKDDWLELEIADNGAGIGEASLPLVFEPFYTSKGQGTGLGLAISYNIISDHGGDIAIDSAAGRGTRVTVRLPVG